MQKRKITTKIQSDEEVIIALPANALETLGIPLSGQLGTGHNAVESNSLMVDAAIGRGETFPCFKKSVWGDRLIVKLQHNRSASTA